MTALGVRAAGAQRRLPGGGDLMDVDARGTVRTVLDENLFVDASAGTGKTTELIERVVELYRTGAAEPGRIAAITFTDAAAAELRHRVRARLEQCIAEPGQDPHGRLRLALAAMDEAAFTTLHGFAQRLLVQYPLEAGLPPVIELLSEVDETIEFERRWDEFLTDLVEDPSAGSLLRRAVDLGLKQSALRDLAEQLHDGHDRVASIASGVALPGPEIGPLIAVLGDVLELRTSCRTSGDLLLQHIDTTVAALRAALLRTASPEDVIRCLASAPGLRSTAGAAQQWNGCKPRVRDLLGEAQGLLERQLTVQRDAVGRALAGRVAAFVGDWAADRQRAGRLRYHDLLVLARRLLADRPRVRAALRERYSILLLDEFQDTDPLQIEIAALLAGDGDEAGPWQQTTLRPGRLFVVGDPKQSIYRFRRADITVYERARRLLGMRGVTLTQNFRSVPGIAEWVNAAFGVLLGEGEPDAQPAYSPLIAERDALGRRPAVHRFGGPRDELTAAVREVEAGEVARAVRRILDEGWQIADPETGVARTARHRDIAILVRRHAGVRLLERTLTDAGIPYRIESKSLIFATDEIRDLVTILTAIDDPADEVAVVAAIRHPALGCDDRALVDWRAAGGQWDYRADRPPGLPADHPVADAMDRLLGLHERRWSFSVGGLIEHVIAELRLLELGFARSRPRDRWRRLRFLADQAHAFHAVGGHLRGFLRWARRQEEQDVRVDEFVVDEPDDDAVRITTVHGAKGLEYPIVVLLGLDGDTNRLPSTTRVLWEADGGVQFSLGGDLRTAGWSAARTREIAMHVLEEVRLLYVGATRARDHLLVSLHHRRGTRCHAAALLDIPGLGSLWSPLELPPSALPVQTPQAAGAAEGAPARGPDDLAAWWRGRQALADRARRPTAIAATSVATALAPPEGHLPASVPLVEDDIVPSHKGRGGTSFGRAVHAVLQTVDLAQPGGVADLARVQAAVEGISDAASQVAEAAATALRSPTVRAAVASGRYWREYYVGAPVEGAVLEGFLDLLYDDRDGLVVVDYKTDRLEGRTAEQAAACHRPQAASYALALEAALGRPVARCVLVFARDSGAEEVVIAGAALAAAMDEVRACLKGGL
jgi:ATP-dependent helicase/nuclease subunit A